MMDEKQIESLKRRYGSRIADAPKQPRDRNGWRSWKAEAKRAVRRCCACFHT